jgi:hypothetical protein
VDGASEKVLVSGRREVVLIMNGMGGEVTVDGIERE